MNVLNATRLFMLYKFDLNKDNLIFIYIHTCIYTYKHTHTHTHDSNQDTNSSIELLCHGTVKPVTVQMGIVCIQMPFCGMLNMELLSG